MEFYARGRPQEWIARELGVAQGTVSGDIKAIHQQWRERMVGDLNDYKLRELAKLDLLEVEYWAGWQRSQADRERRISEQLDGGGAEGAKRRARIEREGQAGAAIFLAGVNKCIEQRCKLLGLNEPETLRLLGMTRAPEVTETMSEQEAAEVYRSQLMSPGAPSGAMLALPAPEKAPTPPSSNGTRH